MIPFHLTLAGFFLATALAGVALLLDVTTALIVAFLEAGEDEEEQE